MGERPGGVAPGTAPGPSLGRPTRAGRYREAVASAFHDAVSDFVTEVGAALTDVMAATATGDAALARRDAALEAFALACAVIDSDGRHGDDELWALITTFAPLMDTQLAGATPATVREAGLVAGRAGWLSRPSELFATLAAYDRSRGSTFARSYAHRAFRLGLALAPVDLVTSEPELHAVEALRGALLAAAPAAPTPSPGAPSGGSTAPTATGPAAAGTTAATGVPAPAEPGPVRPLEELLDELDELVGLAGVKAEVRLVANLLTVQRLRRDRGLPVLERSNHLVFTGNPGTGKTTVARLLAEIYRALGVVARGHLVETDRAGMVAGYVGQTAPRVTALFDTADEGVLLIDEAYTLARGGERDFGQEAIDTLVKLIEDRRDRIVVIAAGYPEEMATFIGANPGLRSRFPKTIEFPDYSTDELLLIFSRLGTRNRYVADDAALARARAFFEGQPRDKGFGNARLARNLFEAAVTNHATRVVALAAPDEADLTTLISADIPATVTP